MKITTGPAVLAPGLGVIKTPPLHCWPATFLSPCPLLCPLAKFGASSEDSPKLTGAEVVNVRGRQTSSSSRSKLRQSPSEDTVGIQNMECGESFVEPEGLRWALDLGQSSATICGPSFSSVKASALGRCREVVAK